MSPQLKYANLGSSRGVESAERSAPKTREFERQANRAIVGWISETDAVDRRFASTKSMYYFLSHSLLSILNFLFSSMYFTSM